MLARFVDSVRSPTGSLVWCGSRPDERPLNNVVTPCENRHKLNQPGRKRMKTYSIHHEVGIKASPKAVYQALTDRKKLAGWWTSDTRGNGSKVGGVLEFWFGDSCHKFEVIELQPGELVRWKANRQEGVEGWAG